MTERNISEVKQDLASINAEIADINHSKFRGGPTELQRRLNVAYAEAVQCREFIEARLRDGGTVEECKMICDLQQRAWGSDPEMSDNVNPITLFRPTNFPKYQEKARRALQRAEKGRKKVEKRGGKSLAEIHKELARKRREGEE